MREELRRHKRRRPLDLFQNDVARYFAVGQTFLNDIGMRCHQSECIPLLFWYLVFQVIYR